MTAESLNEALIAPGERRRTRRYAEQCRNHQRARAAQVNVSPVLRDDDSGNCDGHQHASGAATLIGRRMARRGTATSASPNPKADRISVATNITSKT